MLQAGWFGECGSRVPLILCSRCGAHGTAKVAKLAAPCPAVGGQAIPRDAPFRKQARLAAKSMHPSRNGVTLHGLKPLKPFVFKPLPPEAAVFATDGGDVNLTPQSVLPPARLSGPPPPDAHGAWEPGVPDVQVHEGPQAETEEAVLFDSHLGFDED